MDEAAGREGVGHFFNLLERGGLIQRHGAALSVKRRGLFPRRHRAAAEIHGHAQAHAVHDAHGAGDVLGGAIDVVVQVNEAMPGAPLRGVCARPLPRTFRQTTNTSARPRHHPCETHDE